MSEALLCFLPTRSATEGVGGFISQYALKQLRRTMPLHATRSILAFCGLVCAFHPEQCTLAEFCAYIVRDVISHIELAAEARVKKPALNADAGTIDDTQLDLDKRLTEAEKHAIDIVDVGGTLDEEERSVEVGACARCGANAVEVANAGDEGKVCRRCWRNLRAQQLMEPQGPAVVAIMSPESQEEEK